MKVGRVKVSREFFIILNLLVEDLTNIYIPATHGTSHHINW